MDLARMRPGDYPAAPASWQLAPGPGDGRYGVQARGYSWDQCRYCGAAGRECPKTTCLACGTPQCKKPMHGECLVCFAGWLEGYSRTSYGASLRDRSTCGYKGCDGRAVAKAPRVGQACAPCLSRAVVHIRGARITLADSIGANLAQRDRGGQSWQHIAWFGPPKRYFVRRYAAVDVDVYREGWVGPIDTAGQADREVKCWRDAGHHAERWEATPEVTARVAAWQAAADRRLGRTVAR
jgi:hypothetical protein